MLISEILIHPPVRGKEEEEEEGWADRMPFSTKETGRRKRRKPGGRRENNERSVSAEESGE